jgi:hypothetical protein
MPGAKEANPLRNDRVNPHQACVTRPEFFHSEGPRRAPVRVAPQQGNWFDMIAQLRRRNFFGK